MKSFKDTVHIEHGRGPGFDKVRKTCFIAKKHGFDFVWIDTCCIDKTSSAELSEAIISMYRWYRESRVCYAYLADVPSNISFESLKSNWFYRGWTLQELIAPSVVVFFDQKWQEIGTKSSLRSIISGITGIPNAILEEADLESVSVAQRMSWASKRETTRVEDRAYCLMGIFGVNMPIIYGEGENAFLRLQEEIIKISDDHSLFAWKSLDGRCGLLATSPAAFLESGKIVPSNSSNILSGALSGPIRMNKQGINLKVRFMDMDRTSFQRVGLAILPCAVKGDLGKTVGIYVRAISEAEGSYVRTMSNRLELINLKNFAKSKYSEENICVPRRHRLYNGQSLLATSELTTKIDETLSDDSDAGTDIASIFSDGGLSASSASTASLDPIQTPESARFPERC